MDKKSFIIHIDSLNVLDDLNDEQTSQLFRAIRNYHTGDEINLSGLMKAVFTPFKNQFDRDNEKYLSIVERNKKNGKKGGRPKNPKEPKKPSGYSGNPDKPKKADSDNDSDSVNDSVSDNENNNNHLDFQFPETHIHHEDKEAHIQHGNKETLKHIDNPVKHFTSLWNEARVKILKMEHSNVNSVPQNARKQLKYIYDTYTLEELKTALRGLFKQKNKVLHSLNHFLAETRFEEYYDAELNKQYNLYNIEDKKRLHKDSRIGMN